MNGVTGNVGVCVILPNKPGEYRTEPVGEITPIETWDYFYCGRHLATFVVATLHGAARIRVIDETESPNPVTVMPVRFLEKFRDRDAAVASLDTLAGPGRPETELRRRSPSPANR